MTNAARVLFLVIVMIVAVPASAAEDALDWAFTFASAIEDDPTDKGRAQHATLMEYLELGALDRAERLSHSVEGWRRGIVYAELAARFARDGQVGRAQELIGRAEQVRSDTSGWQRPRIEAHIAQALAYLGDIAGVGDIGARLTEGDARQYAGRAAATLASAQGSAGNFEQAMQTLHSLDAVDDLDTVWWRTTGYLDLARGRRFDADRRRAALVAARESARDLQGWKQAEILLSIAREGQALGRAQSKIWIQDADRSILSLGDAAPARAPLLAELARTWGESGEMALARERLDQALQAAPRVMEIDQPEVLARIARASSAMGDAALARQLFERALAVAGGLANSRPRALAIRAMLCSMASARVEIDETFRLRLAALRAGLGDPW